MENLIDKDELLESFNASDFETYNDYSHTFDVIDSAPEVEYKKVIRAEWIDTGMPNAYGGKVMKCSNCGTRLIMSPERYENRFEYERFCSCCGAMIYEKDDED